MDSNSKNAKYNNENKWQQEKPETSLLDYDKNSNIIVNDWKCFPFGCGILFFFQSKY